MDVQLFQTKTDLGKAAAATGANAIRAAIEAQGRANIVVATGASQFEILEALVSDPTIDWSKVTGFHLDEYIGMPDTHPASFRRYLRERFTSKLPALGGVSFYPWRCGRSRCGTQACVRCHHGASHRRDFRGHR